MVIVNSYVKLPEGSRHDDDKLWDFGVPSVQTNPFDSGWHLPRRVRLSGWLPLLAMRIARPGRLNIWFHNKRRWTSAIPAWSCGVRPLCPSWRRCAGDLRGHGKWEFVATWQPFTSWSDQIMAYCLCFLNDHYPLVMTNSSPWEISSCY